MNCFNYIPVIPATFDDTITLYETVCKLAEKVNELVDAVNALQAQVDELKGAK